MLTLQRIKNERNATNSIHLAQRRSRWHRWLEKGVISQENHHFYILVNYAALVALIGHVIFAILFGLLDIKPLFIYNIFSAVIYLACYIWNRRGAHYLAQAVGSLEVITHAVLATFYVGNQSGFSVYIISIIVLVFFSPMRSFFLRVFVFLICSGLYIGLEYYSRLNPPFIPLSPNITSTMYYTNTIAFLFVIAILVHYYRLAVNQVERSLRQANIRLELLASTDPLTKLLNRRGMAVILQNEADRAKESQEQFSLILADIDNFKMINDQYGHECGDLILAGIGTFFRNALRERDQIARWGGEEFLILLPDTPADGGKKIAERLKSKIEENVFHYKKWTIPVTLTFGITVYNGLMDIMNCINEADEALRQGKQQGKNCVILH
jgi:diguanylate cyclase (GGDEF)-like protein